MKPYRPGRICGALLAAILPVALAATAYGLPQRESSPPQRSGSSTDTPASAPVLFACRDGRAIVAQFNEEPAGTGSVTLTTHDPGTDWPASGQITLPHARSADGARFAAKTGATEFWNVGNGARLTLETTSGSATTTECIVVAPDPGGLPEYYADVDHGFSIRYPRGATVNPDYSYEALGPGKSIPGVSFNVPDRMTSTTNLAPDTSISVETLPPALAGSANPGSSDGTSPQTHTAGVQDFLGQYAAPPKTETVNGTTYSVSTTGDAGAGNRYEEQVYAIPGTNPLVAIRYFIHYNVIENYPKGAVREFDRDALMAMFNAMRSTLVTNGTHFP